jgi:molecular chaperone DnaJ
MRAAGGLAAEYDFAMGTRPADDYYALLGVDANASLAALRRAWRRLAQQWHPDRAGPEATAIFQRIAAAYAVLSDPTARAAYDRRRGPIARGSRPPPSSAAAAATAPSAAPAAPDVPVRRRAPGVMLTRLSRPLNVLLASGIARRAEGEVIELFLDAEEAAQGGMVTISMRVPVRCSCVTDGTAVCARCDSQRTVEDLFSAWLAVPPEVTDGTVLTPSALLPGMIRPVSFRVRVGVDDEP